MLKIVDMDRPIVALSNSGDDVVLVFVKLETGDNWNDELKTLGIKDVAEAKNPSHMFLNNKI